MAEVIMDTLPGCTTSEHVSHFDDKQAVPACIGGVSTRGCVHVAECEKIKWFLDGEDGRKDLVQALQEKYGGPDA